MRLSKSRFVAGVQCLRRLYLLVHQPELAAEAGGGAEAIMAQGQDVGEVARKAFPGGVLVSPDHEHLDEAIRMTKELVGNRSVRAIFEATFEFGRVLVRVDVLHRIAANKFRLLEVKSSTGMKDHYAYDIGIQKYVAIGTGLQIQDAFLMHLNREYVFSGGEYELSTLFSTEAVPAEIEVTPAEIARKVRTQLKVLEGAEPPKVEPGTHCTDPFPCEFFEQCNPPVPADHVSQLPGIRANKVADLLAKGVVSIHQIPEDYPLSERQRMACKAVCDGTPWIGPELQPDLSQLNYPLCFMDFETVYPALPRFTGMRPYDHIPFQWSVHRQESPRASLEHYEFLAEDDRDPRLAFVESLCQALKGAATIVVYNQGFESGRLADLARWLPKYAATIGGIQGKLFDLLPVIRRNVYHPAFAGSYSLKQVLPALLPQMTYAGMQVANGEEAGIIWQQMVARSMADPERQRLRSALLEYCGQDTLALVRLVSTLR
jgi:predicted RecB family nuclease